MHHFHYRDGRLRAEDVDLTALAETVGTPFYCYATATLERHYEVFAKAFGEDDALVCFAMKANSNPAVLAQPDTRQCGRAVAGSPASAGPWRTNDAPAPQLVSGLPLRRGERRAGMGFRPQNAGP